MFCITWCRVVSIAHRRLARPRAPSSALPYALCISTVWTVSGVCRSASSPADLSKREGCLGRGMAQKLLNLLRKLNLAFCTQGLAASEGSQLPLDTLPELENCETSLSFHEPPPVPSEAPGFPRNLWPWRAILSRDCTIKWNQSMLLMGF